MSKLDKGTIQTWLPTIMGIVIVLLLGGGILAWQSGWMSKKEVEIPPEEKSTEVETENETANRETYRNEEYGIEFKYPSGFSISSGPAPFIGGDLSIDIDAEEYFLDEAEQSSYIAFEKDNSDLSVCQQTYCCEYTDWSSDYLTELGLSETKKSNNAVLYRYVFGEADMQASYNQARYKTFYKSECYKITLLIRESSGLYKAGPKYEEEAGKAGPKYTEEERIDKVLEARNLSNEKILKTFSQLLSTLTFLK